MLIVCNGMLRSGSTLQYNIARSLVEKIGIGRGEAFFDNNYILPEGDFIRWAEDTRHHVIKMHVVHPNAARLAANGYVRICYIYRDIRDVAVSAKRMFYYEGQELIDALDLAIETYYKLQTIENVLWQKYEDLATDISAQVVNIAEFLGLDPPQEIIADIAEEFSLKNVQLLTTQFRYRLRRFFEHRATSIPESLRPLLRRTGVRYLFRKAVPYSDAEDARTLLLPGHISKHAGAKGVWRTTLKRQEIETITKRYQEWLTAAGYSDSC